MAKLLSTSYKVLVAGVALAILARSTIIDSFRVCERSMEKTLYEDDRIFSISKDICSIDRGDIVAFSSRDAFKYKALVKRVANLPGEHYVICSLQDHIYNGEYNKEHAPCVLEERVLAPDEYFVLGDNEEVSVDSRDFGPVKYQNIIGEVVYAQRGARQDKSVSASDK